MQLTSSTGATSTERSGGSSILARLNRPVAAGAIAFLGWLAFVVARWHVWAHGHITLFIMSGVKYSHPDQMSPRISHVPLAGYDGQFYYRFARNPFNWDPTAYGITIDHNYRYTRLGYPIVTWLLSLGGQARLVPTMLVVVNLLCIAAVGWLGAKFARDSGRHALWGLLLVAYFGLVISVGRDTSEPLADACMLGGLLAYRRSRHVLAALLLAYGAITNEPILAAAVGIALTRLYQMYKRRAKPGWQDLAWVLPGAAYVVLEGLEKVLVKGTSGGVSDITQNITLPFRDMIPWLITDVHRLNWTHLGLYDYNVIEAIALLVVVVAGLLVLRSTTAPVHERVVFVVFVCIEMVFASSQFWGSVFGDGRTYVESFMMGIVLLLATPPAVATAGEAASRGGGVLPRLLPANRVITNKRLAWIAAIAVAALLVVARRRILFQ
ncbi:MAG: hypothetical protein J2P25_14640 [Nocardiopsaceae bacterium]|nr:hypothetical protein [Nocardiopsaceae bacterium]